MSNHAPRHRLAGELRELLAVADDEEPVRLRDFAHRVATEYSVLFDADDRLHEIYHFVTDADGRERDAVYAAWQPRRIAEIIQHLDGPESSL